MADVDTASIARLSGASANPVGSARTASALHADAATLVIENGVALELRFADRLDAVQDEWETLEARAVSTPFQTFAWVDAWQASIGAGNECQPLVALLYSPSGLQLILPLAIQPMLASKCLTWLGHDLNDYCAPLVAGDLLDQLTPADAHAIMQAVGSEAAHRGASLANLPKQPEQLGGRSNPFAQDRSFAFSSMAHSARIDGDWQAFFTQRRGKSTRRRIAQKTRRLEAKGEVEFAEVSDREELLKVIRQTLEWKQQQLSDQVASNQLDREYVPEFLADLVQREASKTGLCGYRLSLEGVPIATAFGFVHGDSFLLYQTAYTCDDHSECSPGLLLLTRMMEASADRGLNVFDFSLGDEGYKFQWSDEHSALTASCYALKPQGMAHAQFFKQASVLKRFLKTRPGALNAANSLIKYCRACF